MVRGLARRMLFASAVVALVIATAFVVLLQKIDNMSTWTAEVGDSQGVLATAQEIQRVVLEVETGERGYLLTAEESYLVPWHAAQANLPPLRTKLQQLARLPLPAEYSRRLVQAAESYIKDYSIPLVSAARAHDPSARSLTRLAEGQRRIDEITADFDGLDRAEQQLLGSRQQRVLSAGRIARVAVVAGLAGSLMLIVLFALYLSRAMVKPIRRAARMARTLADGDLSARMPETAVGEIGGLEKSFNMMAGSLEVSRDDLSRLAEEQAALRRVATLVARGQPPDVIFNAVTEELAKLLQATEATMVRFQADGSPAVVASWRTSGTDRRTDVPPLVETGETRPDDDRPPPSSVGAPIIVNGTRWGVLTAAREIGPPLPEEAETRIANFTDLVATAIANGDARTQLAASRARIVTATDQARRKIERDLHDGTQQRLVSLALDLRMATSEIPDELPQLRSQLSSVVEGLSGAMNDLREISRGIHPAILSEGGLGPALKALARRSAIPVEVGGQIQTRIPPSVEIAAYYVVTEALANAAKHARASVVTVDAHVEGNVLRVSISDDGIGGADPAQGSGLLGLIDRIEALGGTITLTSPQGAGSTLQIRLPFDPL
jgi:signal transduction histidine kinase